MSTASKRQYYTIILVGALLAGGWVFRRVLRLWGEGEGAVTLSSAGGQVMGLAAMAWLLTTVVLFTIGVVIVRLFV